MSLYPFLFQTLWRAGARLRGSRAPEFFHILKATEFYAAERLRRMQWEKLKNLLAHAYDQVPFYRERFDRLNLSPDGIRTPEDFARIPPLTREDLVQNRERLTARHARPGDLHTSSTGGSTGKPVHFQVDKAHVEWGNAIVHLQDLWAGLSPGEPHAFLWGGRIDLARQRENLKVRLANRIRRNLFLDSFAMDEESLAEYIRLLTRFRPKLLTGYVLALQILARYTEVRGLAVPSIGAIQTGAEPLRDSQRRMIRDGLAAPVFERYGGRDIGAIAHECEAHHGMHVFMLNYYVESVRGDAPAAPGEKGELLVTHLDNFAAPFLRYRSEDLGVLSDRDCPCGRRSTILEGVEGRIVDLIVGENGRVLPGEFFPHLFKDYAIGEFQVIQKERDRLVIKLVGRPGFSLEDRERIVQTIQKYLGAEMRVEIDPVLEIPPTASGKFRVTISELPGDRVRQLIEGD